MRYARKRKPLEFKEKVIDIRRVVRVTAGGKRFRFRATLVMGDEKGRVGVGVAKGADVQQAVEKARAKGKKDMIHINLKGRTIEHGVQAKYSAARVMLRPAREGHGLIAGGAARVVLSLAGVKDITAKCIGRTTNKLTNALATVEALKKIKAAKPKAAKKGDNKEEVKEEAIVAVN
jgi:small subunit ribosomal protein S5